MMRPSPVRIFVVRNLLTIWVLVLVITVEWRVRTERDTVVIVLYTTRVLIDRAIDGWAISALVLVSRVTDEVVGIVMDGESSYFWRTRA